MYASTTFGPKISANVGNLGSNGINGGIVVDFTSSDSVVLGAFVVVRLKICVEADASGFVNDAGLIFRTYKFVLKIIMVVFYQMKVFCNI